VFHVPVAAVDIGLLYVPRIGGGFFSSSSLLWLDTKNEEHNFVVVVAIYLISIKCKKQ
jgi:hypothetical protein